MTGGGARQSHRVPCLDGVVGNVQILQIGWGKVHHTFTQAIFRSTSMDLNYESIALLCITYSTIIRVEIVEHDGKVISVFDGWILLVDEKINMDLK